MITQSRSETNLLIIQCRHACCQLSGWITDYLSFQILGYFFPQRRIRTCSWAAYAT